MKGSSDWNRTERKETTHAKSQLVKSWVLQPSPRKLPPRSWGMHLPGHLLTAVQSMPPLTPCKVVAYLSVIVDNQLRQLLHHKLTSLAGNHTMGPDQVLLWKTRGECSYHRIAKRTEPRGSHPRSLPTNCKVRAASSVPSCNPLTTWWEAHPFPQPSTAPAHPNHPSSILQVLNSCPLGISCLWHPVITWEKQMAGSVEQIWILPF